MAMNDEKRIWVATPDAIAEVHHLRIEVIHGGKPASVIVIRYQGQYLAYLNRCVHMPRELDCEHDMIFDAGTEKLRCSMHGIQYDPLTGQSLSAMCPGEALQSIRLSEDEVGLWIRDKRVKPLAT
ncbi:Rieske (2Fe-2S) protein [Azomonas macrocytogenes]|uniref:Nitrite reductase/ring-hydroxylating ferredoxin subunit n=1 Tax=Azomonas macrocytogenes TaxID=69962 RepID=A0A839T699_AZOMA|nr:Rieske 2Fe-2S domain-containing protein [Azomonas macrocytogenes]MBB3103475.1 nitrite reductase/ring-hydroxylating ferredoxin subunit [Azomonas macrocytogenes]